jgi:hypothetical protein
VKTMTEINALTTSDSTRDRVGCHLLSTALAAVGLLVTPFWVATKRILADEALFSKARGTLDTSRRRGDDRAMLTGRACC